MLSELEKESVRDAVHAVANEIPVGVPFGARRIRALVSAQPGITAGVLGNEEFKATVEETLDNMLNHPQAFPGLQIAPEFEGEHHWVRTGAA